MDHATTLTIDQAADVVDTLAPFLGGDRYHRAVCAVQRRVFVVAPHPHFTFDGEDPWTSEVQELWESYDAELKDNAYRTAIRIGQ
mgnify:CR=1 FL=1